METVEKNQAARARLIKRASLVALFGNLVLAAAKIITGLTAGSLAVVGDGIDTAVDVLIAAMQFFIAGVTARPADAGHPWGHGRAETVGTAGLSFLLFFAGFELIARSVSELVNGAEHDVPELAAFVVTVISIAGKLLLAFNQYRMGKKAGSVMLSANAKNMAADVVVSAGVLLGLLFSQLFNIGSIDTVAAILVGLWVIKAAVGIFAGVNSELMDGGALNEQYRSVFEAVHSVPGAGNPHRTRIRRISGFLDIDIDIEVDGELSVHEAHAIATEVENAIRRRLENVFDIMVHVEPSGDTAGAENEAYGLNEKTVNRE
ncbi:MAG: cation diffusion facilitator family transporter [Spirochaetaceae bacterium]|jgi:cation diffusion facilitator family transporter|nr:cation diffusion facilitator family transporter [Spirochaetaceae bacterium]